MNPGHVLDGTVLEPRNIPRIRQKLGITALPADGTTGQVLTKLSDADGDVGWATVSGGSADDTLIWLNL